MTAFKQWLNGLEPQERKKVIAAIIVGIIGAFYWGVWQPIHQLVADKEQAIIRQDKLNQWVKESIQQIQGANQGGGRTASGSLTQIVNRSSYQYKITIARMQPRDEQLQIWIDNAEFNQLIQWLNHLENQQNLGIVSLDVGSGDMPGFVKVRKLQLEKRS